MQFTAVTFFTWSRSSSAPAKFQYNPTVHFWTLTILCLVLCNCDHVVCTSAGNSRNTSTRSVKPPTQPVVSYNCSTQEALKRITFCHTVALELLGRDFQTFNKTCAQEFNKLTEMDNQTGREFNKFRMIMERVDCRSKYSVRWKCSDCLDAYKDWICETFFTEHLSSNRSLNRCHKVIQRCPYFLPATDNQYSGQPAFDC